MRTVQDVRRNNSVRLNFLQKLVLAATRNAGPARRNPLPDPRMPDADNIRQTP